MRKIYQKPEMMVVHEECMAMICTGSNGVSSDLGMDFGGVDEDGNIIPEARDDGFWEDD